MIFPEAAWLFAQVGFADDAAIHALVADVLQVAVLAPLGHITDLRHPVPLFDWLLCNLVPCHARRCNLHCLEVFLGTLGELIAQALAEIYLSKKTILYPGGRVLFAALTQHNEGVDDAQVDQEPEKAAPMTVLRDPSQRVARQQLLADVDTPHVLLQQAEGHGAVNGVQSTYLGLRPSPNSIWLIWSCIC